MVDDAFHIGDEGLRQPVAPGHGGALGFGAGSRLAAGGFGLGEGVAEGEQRVAHGADLILSVRVVHRRGVITAADALHAGNSGTDRQGDEFVQRKGRHQADEKDDDHRQHDSVENNVFGGLHVVLADSEQGRLGLAQLGDKAADLIEIGLALAGIFHLTRCLGLPRLHETDGIGRNLALPGLDLLTDGVEPLLLDGIVAGQRLRFLPVGREGALASPERIQIAILAGDQITAQAGFLIDHSGHHPVDTVQHLIGVDGPADILTDGGLRLQDDSTGDKAGNEDKPECQHDLCADREVLHIHSRSPALRASPRSHYLAVWGVG